jgi:uncharacterized membrane protein YraQ (UPF0718 family)
MLGAPIVSPIVALSTYAAFRGQHPLEMTCLRLGLGFLIAVIVGLILQQIPAQSIMQTGITPEAVPAQGRGGLRVASFSEAQQSLESRLGSRLQKAIYSAATDFLDVAVFFIIGAAITSLLGTAVQRSVLDPLASNPLLAIISLMLVAIALALCSTTDAFIAATSFPSFPMTAKLAFLVFGAMFDLKLYWLYGLIFKRKVVILLGLSLFIGIALICWRLNALGF